MLVGVQALVVVVLIQASLTFALPSSFHFYQRATGNITTLPPSQDPFYVVPDDIASIPRGRIIRSRKLPDVTQIFGPDAGDAYQLFYRTNGVNMKPDATVTTVVAPRNPNSGTPNIVAISTPEDAAALDCAPSWALYPNSQSLAAVGGVQPTSLEATASLFNGYYVTIPDQEGSQSGWLAYSEGQAMLDGILAIVNHKKTIPNSDGYKAALTGYSGGGHGSAWAAQLASTYGKGTPIVALAAGGVPANLEKAIKYLDGTSGSGLVFAGVAGLSNLYPRLNKYINSILKPNGTEALELVRSGKSCVAQTGTALAGKSFVGSTTSQQPFKNQLAQRILEHNILGKYQPPILEFPVYLTHSRADETVIFGPVLDYYNFQCSQGSRIVLSDPPIGSHAEVAIKSLPSFFYFIKRAFEGTIGVQGCRKMPAYLIPFDGSSALSFVGPTVEAALTSFGASLS